MKASCHVYYDVVPLTILAADQWNEYTPMELDFGTYTYDCIRSDRKDIVKRSYMNASTTVASFGRR